MTTTDLAAQADKAAAKAADARAAAEADAVARFEAEEQRADEWANIVLARYPDDDAELRKAEREANTAFTDALLSTDWVQAWIAARAARLRREHLAAEVRGAAEKLNVQANVPDVPYRDPRLLETLTDALERAARNAAADAADERQAAADQFIRPDADEAPRGPRIHPDVLALLRHADNCPQDRIEAVEGGVRCIDCKADHITPKAKTLPPPGSPEYARLWRMQPFEIARALDPADRNNPQLNPLHPNALDDPPGYHGGRPIPHGE